MLAAAAWEAQKDKSLASLTSILKEHKYGCGKWMIFAPASEVDGMWRKIVEALWSGKLGHSAKVSGALMDSSKSHVICVYVDPFWEVSEVERVLSALSHCRRKQHLGRSSLGAVHDALDLVGGLLDAADEVVRGDGVSG